MNMAFLVMSQRNILIFVGHLTLKIIRENSDMSPPPTRKLPIDLIEKIQLLFHLPIGISSSYGDGMLSCSVKRLSLSCLLSDINGQLSRYDL